MKNLFGITKGVDINNIAVEKEFSDDVLGVMDGAMGGMFVFREKKGDLLDYTKNAKCLTSMCASSETGTRDNPKQTLSGRYWKEGFVGVVVVKDGVVVSDPLYIALQCNSDEVIDMSKVDFTGFSKGSSIDIFVNGLGGRNLQIKRYIIYPVYASGYGSISENSVQSEFNINGNFTDRTALDYCKQEGTKPAYIKYLIIGTKR
ncbi:MAG: hypothetical protein PHO23_02785 [Candidatus Pacebacteria bacterium]|nr:hypothetical protein [Candidatus Paceibacterota bacterium]